MSSHPQRRLGLDVDVSTLYDMRAQGLSNTEIASALGVSLGTVYKYIGKQGGWMKTKCIREGIERGMTCPQCFGKTRVIKSDEVAETYVDAVDHFEMENFTVLRRRRCLDCGYRFTTVEKRVEDKRKCTSD